MDCFEYERFIPVKIHTGKKKGFEKKREYFFVNSREFTRKNVKFHEFR
jgi:hypothetical protein